MKKIKTQNIIIVILGLVLIIIILLIIYINRLAQEANKQARKNIAQQITPAVVGPQPTASTHYVFPTPFQQVTPVIELPHAKPQVEWDVSASNKLLDKIQNRKPRTASDTEAMIKMFDALFPEDGYSGILYESPNIIIDYTEGPDIFQVEITNVNIDLAKEEANKWFLDQGISQDAICNYPVEFYLNSEIMHQLSNTNTVFNPLAPGCE